MRRRVSAAGLAGSLAMLLAVSSDARQLPQAPPGAVSPPGLAVGCGPRLALDGPLDPPFVLGSQEGQDKDTFGPPDTLVVAAGATGQLQPGQQFYVRRLQRWQGDFLVDGRPPAVLHTAGWIRILEVDTYSATAEIVHACEGLSVGDFLEPFEPAPTLPVLAAAGNPDYSSSDRVLFGVEGRQAGAEGDLMLATGGTAGSFSLGQRVTFFRTPFGPPGPIQEIGEGVVVEVHPLTAMVRIQRTRQAVETGDLVAPRRSP